MDKLSMCRVCLVRDVPMRIMVNKALQQVYEDLTKIRFVSKSRRPTLVCVMCCAKLQSCHRFKTSCLQGEALLKQILEKDAAINKLSTSRIKHVTCSGDVGIADNASEESEQQRSTLMHSIVTEVNPEHLQDSASVHSQGNDEDELEVINEMLRYNPDRIITTVKIESCEGDDFEVDKNMKLPGAPRAAAKPKTAKTVKTAKKAKTAKTTKKAKTAVEVKKVPQRAASIETQQGEPEQRALTDRTPASNLIPTSDLTSTSNRLSQEKPSKKALLKTIKIVLQRCDHMMSNEKKPLEPPIKILGDSSKPKPKSYECDVCAKRFHQENILSTHKRLHFQSKKPFKCDVCNKCYDYKCTLVTHLRLHTGEKPYECGVCKKRFNEKTNLLSHTRTHTGEKPFECDVCKKTFIVQNHLVAHYRIHTGERPYKCETCNRTFRQRTLLVQHLRVHTGVKPYKCDMCDASYKQNVSLRRHRLCHTGEKSFKCDMCDERFFKHSKLVIHKRQHDGKRIYECNVCDKAFSMKSHVDAHMRKHTGQKPFKCFACGKCFSQKYNCLKHVKTQHPTRPRRG